MHIGVDRAMRMDEADAISSAIEERIRDSIEEVDSLMLHVEPSKKDMYRIAIPVEEDKGLDSRVSYHFGKSPYFILIDLHENGLRSWLVVENHGARIERKRGIEASRLLVQHKVDVLVAKEVGEGPYHVLRDSSVQLLDLGEESEIGHVLDAFSKKELRSLTYAKEAG
jgi:predicted Fe-Mo cluster-binding NifX family protein